MHWKEDIGISRQPWDTSKTIWLLKNNEKEKKNEPYHISFYDLLQLVFETFQKPFSNWQLLLGRLKLNDESFPMNSTQDRLFQSHKIKWMYSWELNTRR